MSQDSSKRNAQAENKKTRRKEEKARSLVFRTVLPHCCLVALSRDTRCLRYSVFFFISFVVSDSFFSRSSPPSSSSSSLSSSSHLLSSRSVLSEMPHRMRKIVSRYRPPFMGRHHKQYSPAANHHCTCQTCLSNFAQCVFSFLAGVETIECAS